MTGAATFFIKNGSSSVCIPRLVKEFEKVEVGRDFGEFVSGQIGFDDLRPLHSNIHRGDMVPEFGRHIQLSVSEFHPAKIRADLSPFSLKSMTSHTTFTYKKAASSCRVLRKRLGEDR